MIRAWLSDVFMAASILALFPVLGCWLDAAHSAPSVEQGRRYAVAATAVLFFGPISMLLLLTAFRLRHKPRRPGHLFD